MPRIRIALAAIAVALTAAGAAGGAATGSKINLVAYWAPAAAFAKIIPAFQATSAGKATSVSQSYGASGDQTRAVLGGLPADIVDLSLLPDMSELVKGRIVDRSWNANRYHGFVTDSVVVLVLRDGNPKHIKSWDDLTKKGVDIIT